MSIHSGFLYAYSRLGLSLADWRVHYRFEDAGTNISNSAPIYPQMSGGLSSLGSFYTHTGSGLFEGQSVEIQNASGLYSDRWSHIFLFEKTGVGGGVLFDSMMDGVWPSGYTLGVNDNNRLYMEGYNHNGPFSLTSSIVLGKKNLVGISRSQGAVSFFCQDFNNDGSTISESLSLDYEAFFNANKGVLGLASNPSAYAYTNPLAGYIDEYVYTTQYISPSVFAALASGLCSDYYYTASPVTAISGMQITGYENVLTGVTGITGYESQITGSGLDPFGTGSYENYWGAVAQTGYLVSGYRPSPLSGYVTRYITGAPASGVSLRASLVDDFLLDDITYLRRLGQDDLSWLFTYPFDSHRLNLDASYQSIEGDFQLDDSYNTSGVNIYANGQAQTYEGYSVTGDFRGSGVLLSGDYRLDGPLVDTTGFYGLDDSMQYDLISGERQVITSTGSVSGVTESLTTNDNLVFFNGLLLPSGLEYDSSGGSFRWLTNKYSSGKLSTLPVGLSDWSGSGVLLQPPTAFPRGNSILFRNGQRQHLGGDYLESCSLDLLGPSGIFAVDGEVVYNNSQDFFE